MKTILHNPTPLKRKRDIGANIVGAIVVLVVLFLMGIISLEVIKYAVHYITSDLEVIVIQEKK